MDKLVGCSITLTAADTGSPVVTILSGPNGGLTKHIHATNGIVAGYEIHGSIHTTVKVRSFSNPIVFWITGTTTSFRH